MFDRVLLLLENMGREFPVKINANVNDDIKLLILLANAYKVAKEMEANGAALEIQGRPVVLDSILRAYIDTMHINLSNRNKGGDEGKI